MSSKVYPVDLGERRRGLGITQIELAARLGVTNTTISCLENSKMGIGFSLALSLVDIFGQLRVRRGNELYRLTQHGLIPIEQRQTKPEENDDELDDSGYSPESALTQLRQEQKEGVAYHDRLIKDVTDHLATGTPSAELAVLVKEAIADPMYRAQLAGHCIARIDPQVWTEGWRLSREEFAQRGLLKPSATRQMLHLSKGRVQL